MGSSHRNNAEGRAWQRAWRHFTESFSGDLLKPQRAQDGEKTDEWRDRRRRNAYRYILAIIGVVLLPVTGYNFYVDEIFVGGGLLTLLVVVLGNIALLSSGREAAASPHVVLLFSIGLVMLAYHRGQDFALFLMFPLLVALPVLVRMRWAAGILLLSGLVAAPIILARSEPMASFVIGLSLGLSWLVSAWLVFAVSEQSRRLRSMAITDPLTGAYNRRYLELRAAKSLENWQRYERLETMMVIDIDHFKRINDQFGHAEGDRALKALVDLLKARVRSVDTLCRFGGEEFVLLLSEADVHQGKQVGNKLRKAVEGAKILPRGSMTISVGLCEVSQADTVDQWLKLADTALYLAKKNGRNRVEVASTSPVKVVPISKTVPDWR
ncbi:MAG: hypothetical protein CME59_16725 [Halioglobus sp.]|nr:hypothetical protein [Halioglobus sp.]|tara:strand:- start:3075 stop:4217 length:1143 start_codon:yes stop_codon:yes gene_type:complete